MNLPAWQGKAIVSRTAPPELSVEFCGSLIRTGYTTPPLPSELRHAGSGGSSGSSGAAGGSEGANATGAALCARFDRTLMLPLTDLAQKYGPQRIALSHLLMQVVAVFGHRRVIVGAAVLAFDWALTQPGVEKQLALTNCAVDAGGTIAIQPTLRDSGSKSLTFLDRAPLEQKRRRWRSDRDHRPRAATGGPLRRPGGDAPRPGGARGAAHGLRRRRLATAPLAGGGRPL